MTKKLFGLICGMLLWAAGSASAQFTQSPTDSGAADTLAMVYSVIPDVTTSHFKFQMDLYYYNDANRYVGCGVGFTWQNPNLHIDSAKASSFATAGLDGGVFLLDGNVANSNTNHRFQFGGYTLSSPGLLPNPARQRLASYYFTVSSWNPTDSICLDTLMFSGGTDYSFVIYTNNDVVYPYFAGHTCAFDTSYTPPSAIVLSPDSLHFSGIAGGSNPPHQTFQVLSDNINFPFTLSETSSWIVEAPALGTTPKTITVSANTTGLLAGDYKDSILVSAPTATNTPQYEIVTLHLIPPPPEISATPSSFVFNAVASGSNPPSKTLTIKNTGGSVLHWAVSGTQSWLHLVPASGIDSGGVTVSIDITGLVTGTYTDTITITDPLASNNPQKRPVTLNLGSDLPSIVAPHTIYVIVDDDSASIGPRTFDITNGGIGSLTYTLSETSPRLLSETPSSGSAPQTVTVTFKKTAGSTGHDYLDTLWVTSPEATNSPYPVVFFLHYISFPAILGVNDDTLDFTVFECEQGVEVGDSLPSVDLNVLNQGLDYPQSFSISYESDLVTLDTTSGELSAAIHVSSLDPGLPLGIYYDTLWITAPLALGSPKAVIIRYTKSAGIQQPQAVLNTVNLVVPTQENEGPIVANVETIRNQHGGCMPWSITETIPWLNPQTPSGNVAGSSPLIVDATGYVFGQYQDSFIVVTPTAVEDTTKVKIKMVVWKFFGDVNYDKHITVIDIVYYINYLFAGGPVPKPERRVGDVNCDRLTNILDIVYLVNYLFNNGPIPCGNPFK